MNQDGIRLMLAGRADEAIAKVRLAVAQEPEHPSYHFNLGALLMQQDDNRGAIEEFSRAIALDPGYRKRRIASAPRPTNVNVSTRLPSTIILGRFSSRQMRCITTFIARRCIERSVSTS